MTEQTGNNKPNEAEGLAFPLSGNEKLIEEAVDRLEQCLANRDAGVGAWSMVRPEDVRTVLAALRAAGGVR